MELLPKLVLGSLLFCRDAGGVANGLFRLEPRLTPSCPSRGREGGRGEHGNQDTIEYLV
jgi:hypothetical protein